MALRVPGLAGLARAQSPEKKCNVIAGPRHVTPKWLA
jgi:hypothetical protein